MLASLREKNQGTYQEKRVDGTSVVKKYFLAIGEDGKR